MIVAIESASTAGVDTVGGAESAPWEKDADRMRRLVTTARSA
ncbi:MAG: hypothetical protein ACKO38_18445 [Planctomycetota bacterium]